MQIERPFRHVTSDHSVWLFGIFRNYSLTERMEKKKKVFNMTRVFLFS